MWLGKHFLATDGPWVRREGVHPGGRCKNQENSHQSVCMSLGVERLTQQISPAKRSRMSWGRTGVVAGVACLVACTVGYSGVQVILPQSSGKAAHTSAGGYGGGILDAVTGKLSREGAVMVPRTTCSPGWVLGGGGTKGQTSTNFFG